MDKEKEIEEMADLIGHNKYVRTSEQVACILFDEGYRKADEVRKEVLQGIDNLAAQCGLDEFRAVHLRKYAKQLGVEVDE